MEHGSFADSNRCRYRTGATERKCAESGRFLRKRIGVMGFARDYLPDSVWTVRGLRRKRRACAQTMDCPHSTGYCSVAQENGSTAAS